MDEPSTGLHPSDTKKLLLYLNDLVANGNTLIIIEHNLDIIAQADWIIDIGPGAGKSGGEIMFEGTPADLLKNDRSLTGQHLKIHLTAV